jgi:hypothetical protein
LRLEGSARLPRIASQELSARQEDQAGSIKPAILANSIATIYIAQMI